MKISGKIYLFIAILVFFAASCTKPASKSPGRKNLADIYNPAKNSLHPDFFINHLNDSNSVIYIRIYPSELLFSQANDEGKLMAKFRIQYEMREILPNDGGDLFVDTVAIIRSLKKEDARNSFYTGLPLKAETGKKYSLKVDITDLIRNISTQTILIADKNSGYTAQNFKVLTPGTGYPSFTRFFAPGEQFRIQFNKSGFDSIYVDYYNLDRTLPRPAFSSAPEIPLKSFPDTTIVYPYSDTTLYQLPLPGIYLFRMAHSEKDGLSLFNFGESFPHVKTSDDLLGPLVYLTSSAEFRDIRMEANRKLAIDNFWLSLNPDLASARELIRVYYNRVYFANLYFSSYKEGWKTDRGMIFIIFGPPRMLEKDTNTEKWTYFTRKGGSTAVFEFKRNENLFTNMDYQLVRNVNSSSFWRQAIQTWRKGKVYSIDF